MKTLLDDMIDGCRESVARMQHSIELLENGTMQTRENTGEGWRDTSTQTIAELRHRIGQLQQVILYHDSVKGSQQG